METDFEVLNEIVIRVACSLSLSLFQINKITTCFTLIDHIGSDYIIMYSEDLNTKHSNEGNIENQEKISVWYSSGIVFIWSGYRKVSIRSRVSLRLESPFNRL